MTDLSDFTPTDANKQELTVEHIKALQALTKAPVHITDFDTLTLRTRYDLLWLGAIEKFADRTWYRITSAGRAALESAK